MSPCSRRCTKPLFATKESQLPPQPLKHNNGETFSVPEKAFFDIVVIGSGPAALTFVTRILEERPAALYLEDERQHLHWLQRQSHAAPVLTTRRPGLNNARIIKGTKQVNRYLNRRPPPLRILVLDKLGDGWLGQWHRNFSAYEIPFLRSPMFFHPDPSDVDALLAFAAQTSRAVSRPYTYVCDCLSNRSLHTRHRTTKKSYLDGVCPHLLEVPGVVGREMSKHKWKQSKHKKYAQMVRALGPVVNERDRQDYHNPSAALFRDFTNELVDRFHLQPDIGPDGKVRPLQEWLAEENSGLANASVTSLRADVSDIDYGLMHCECLDGSIDHEAEGFALTTTDGSHIAAKYVVSAVGTGDRPLIPTWVRNAYSQDTTTQRNSNKSSSAQDLTSACPCDNLCHADPMQGLSRPSVDKYEEPSPESMGDGWAHSSAISAPQCTFPPPNVSAKIERGQSTTALVIGGGLTSAQLADLCVRRGFSRVILLLRGFMKVKPFDFSLDWVGKYANAQKMQFWQTEDPQSRMDMIHHGRSGGSINPVYAKVLLQRARGGQLEIRTHTEVEDAHWDPEKQRWSLMLHRSSDARPDSQFMNHTQKAGTSVSCLADYVVVATGTDLGFRELPFMKTLRSKAHVPEVHGIPIVKEDLQYGPWPLFCLGAYSAIQIGPTAFNLGGIREGAERVATRIQDMEERNMHPEHLDPFKHRSSINSYVHFSYDRLDMDAAA